MSVVVKGTPDEAGKNTLSVARKATLSGAGKDL